MLMDWRSRPDITEHMFTDIDPDLDRQSAWIRDRAADAGFAHYVIRLDGSPVGYLSFTDMDRRHRRCSTGSYVAVAEARTAVSHGLNTFICDYVFHHLDFHKILNCFMGSNSKIIRMQKLLNYTYVGCFRDHIVKNGQFHDVHYFEMTRDEWTGQGRRMHPLDLSAAAFEDWGSA